jgi:hypothetical protein
MRIIQNLVICLDLIMCQNSILGDCIIGELKVFTDVLD